MRLLLISFLGLVFVFCSANAGDRKDRELFDAPQAPAYGNREGQNIQLGSQKGYSCHSRPCCGVSPWAYCTASHPCSIGCGFEKREHENFICCAIQKSKQCDFKGCNGCCYKCNCINLGGQLRESLKHNFARLQSLWRRK